MGWLRWLAFALVPLALWPALAWLHGSPTPPAGTVLGRATFAAAAGPTPPAADAFRDARTLPDDWRRHPRGLLEGWYRLDFDVAPSADDQWAVYLPTVSMNAAVWLDGELVGDGGSFAEPVARNWRRPLLWALPGERLAAGAHVLAIRLRADLPDTGLLGPVSVGPLALLAPLQARRAALTYGSVGIITLCLVIAGVFTGAIWLQSGDSTYGWFAAAAFAWAAIHANLLVVTIPVATVTWWGLWYLSLVVWVVALARFLLAFIALDDRPFTRVLAWLAVGGFAVLVPLTLAESSWVHVAARVWITASLPILAVAAVKVVHVLRDQGNDLGVALPHVLGLSVVGCAVHDWLVFVGFAGPTYDWFLPYAAPPVFVGMGLALLRRFVGSLEATAALVADLERRVAAERAALERSYEELQTVEQARVLAAERERIMREMHDGLGSHLVSTLALLESDGGARDAIGHAVRSALDDLRLMVDALEPLDGDLVGALAMLRARLQPRLEAAGIRVEWRVTDLPRLPELGARTVLQVLRILQEAVTNVLKHAEARTLTVQTRTLGAGTRASVAVEISDDGRGFDAGTPAGRGLHHMRRRAAEIGAALAIESAPPGTRVRLSIPFGATA